MTKFKLTAEMLTERCERGLTTKEIAYEISQLSGVRCSPNTIKLACKHYGISLRAKPRKSAFEFEETDLNSVKTETEVVSEVGALEMV